MQKRLLIALVLSFLVMVGYGYLFTPETSHVDQNATKTQTNKESQAPISTSATQNVSAPQTPSIKNRVPIPGKAIATIRSDRFIISIDKLGRISSYVLLEEKFRDEKGELLNIIDPTKTKPLEIRIADQTLNQEAFTTPYRVKGKSNLTLTNKEETLTLIQELNGLTIRKDITFYPTGAYYIKIETSKALSYFITPGYRPVADHSIYLVARGALIKEKDETITVIEDGEAKGTERFEGAMIASAFDRYHATLFYDLDKGLDVSVVKVDDGDPLLFIEQKGNASLNGYIGPKEYKTLIALDPRLEDVIEFGWFTFLAKPFFNILHWIYDHIGNWGWAIILFTILVKLVLFPLSYKGMMSMQKLKDLAPKMKELRDRYKDDPAKLNMKMMELYRKHGANPLGGCLPLLLQIPVFFALYRVLLNAVELQGAEWVLWIEDLSKHDPYFVLPVLMGVSMWVQQHITPTNFTDPMQEKIFKWFPVIVSIFMIYFPAGLVLYWFVSNLLTIAQQYFINRMYEKFKYEQVMKDEKKRRSDETV